MAKSYYLINSFQCPNWMDRLCLLLSGTEFQIFYVTFRKTIADLNKRGQFPEDRKAGIAYSEFHELTGLSNATIAKNVKELVKYKLLIPLPGTISPKIGQVYRLNVVIERNKQRGRETQFLISNRLMDLDGLRRRKEEACERNRQKTAKARKTKAAAATVQEDANLSVKQRASEAPNLSVKQRGYRSVKQRANPSVKQRDHKPSEKTSFLNPHHAPVDPITGEQQKPVCDVSEQQTIFQYLEKTLQKDKRVQKHPPIQPYPVIFEEVMELRHINAWQLQQLITGILADTHINNPIGALRSPDTFKTEKYILAEFEPQPVAGIRQGDVWQQTLATLEEKINRPSFNTWIRPTHAAVKDNTLIWDVPDDTFCFWLWEYYQEITLDTLEQYLGQRPELAFSIGGNPVDMDDFKAQMEGKKK